MGVTEKLLIHLRDMLAAGGLTPAFAAALLVMLAIRHRRRTSASGGGRPLPPGPAGIPIFGSLLQLDKLFHEKMLDYARQFGRLVSVRLGSQLLVLVNDEKLLKKMFGRPEFTARPKTALDSIVEGYGLITTEGPLWQENRRFIHKHKFGLRAWGSSLADRLESRVSHEVVDCLNALARDADPGVPIDPSPYLACSVSNVICSLTMSTRFKILSDQFADFTARFEEGFRLFRITGPTIFLPWLTWLPSIRRTCDKLKANRAEMLSFVGRIVADHGDSLDVEAPRDLVDHYLIEMQQARENKQQTEMVGQQDEEETKEEERDVFQDKDDETQLQQILLDMFSAGYETVKTTLLWSLVHLLRNPEVKARLQAELEEVVGPHRLPSMADMGQLNYCRAVIYETMRRTHAVPLGTTHSNTSPVNVEGYTIPANSHVIPNLHALNMSADLWEEPEAFRPERFLEPATGRCVKPRHFLPFGAGQRMCLGDSLAETELQLFFTSLLHVFDVEAASPEAALPSLDGDLGATFSPHKFDVRLVSRNVEALIIANTKEKPSLSRTCG